MSGAPPRGYSIASFPQVCYGVGNGWMSFPDDPTRGSSSDKGDPQHLSLGSSVKLIQTVGDDKSKLCFFKKNLMPAGLRAREGGLNVR
jgi:hypothetical protein